MHCCTATRAERIRCNRRIRSTVSSLVLIAACTATAMHCETIPHIGASLLQCQLQIYCAAECIRAKCCYYLPVAVQNRLFRLIFQCFRAQSITINFKKNAEHSIPCKQVSGCRNPFFKYLNSHREPEMA